jgi:HPt (histidine-containing phosphotransfer) domain-containing protein
MTSGRFDGPQMTASADTVEELPAVFDWAQFADIEKAVGSENGHLLLTLLATEASTRPSVIVKLASAGSVLTLMAEAHALRGAAGNVGASRLAEAAKALEVAIREGLPTGSIIAEVEIAGAATLDAISERL